MGRLSAIRKREAAGSSAGSSALAPILEAALKRKLCLPERKAHNLVKTLAEYPALPFIVDGTDRPVCRPRHGMTRKARYSGRKKRYVVKISSLSEKDGLCCWVKPGLVDGTISIASTSRSGSSPVGQRCSVTGDLLATLNLMPRLERLNEDPIIANRETDHSTSALRANESLSSMPLPGSNAHVFAQTFCEPEKPAFLTR